MMLNTHLKVINILHIKNIKINSKIITILFLNKNNEFLFNLTKNIFTYQYYNIFNFNMYKYELPARIFLY